MSTNQKDLPIKAAEAESTAICRDLPPLMVRPKQGKMGGWLFMVVYLIIWYVVLKPDMFVVLSVLGFGVVIQALVSIGLKTGKLGGTCTFSSDGVLPTGIRDQQVIPWSKLRLVGLHKPSWMPFKAKLQTIVLNFADYPDIGVDLASLNADQRTSFFRILARYAPQRLLAPEVLYMQLQCLNGNEPSVDGFTQIWSEEFDRRFELANHISLPTGSMCGNSRYIVEMTLATRFSSTTYLVSDQHGKPLVLKELVIPIETDDRAKHKLLEQFDREAAILAGLKHDGIVKVIDHFVENGRSYLVMDRAPGDSLRQQIRLVGTFDAQSTIKIAKQLAEILVYLHDQEPPVIHRDVTPDNVVYSQDTGRVTLVDFGAANIYRSHGTGTLIGKQGYMPPEQYKGKATPASDIYALGSTMLFMLTGMDPPGMGKVPTEAEKIDQSLRTIVQSCLQFEFADRPSADQLLEQLEKLSGNVEGA